MPESPPSKAFDTQKWVDLPKVELHCHLEGTLRLETVISEFKRHGEEIPENHREYFLTERPVGSLFNFITQGFDRCFASIKDLEGVKRMAYECIEDKGLHNVKLLELRYAPILIADHIKEPVQKVHEVVVEGIAAARKDLAAKGIEMEIGLIAISVSACGKEHFKQTMDFAFKNKSDFIAFDIAGGEELLFDYAEEMTKVKKEGMRITIHAGEDRVSGHPENVEWAVKNLHAERIGHGVQSHRRQSLLDLLKEKDVHLEVCPFSNWITGAVDKHEEHPIKKLHAQGISLSINSDDPGVFGTTILTEYAVLHEVHGFDVEDFFRINRNALKASFIADDKKEKVLKQHFNDEAEKEFIDSTSVAGA